MEHPYFFGYGSLVNAATHDFSDPQPAHLSGWRRAWRHTDLRPVAFLTAVPAPGHEIAGMIAQVPHADWQALDQREWAYDRIPATQAISHALPDSPEISVYAVPEEHHKGSTTEHPVLLSYLDVVIQGYLRHFGEDGVRHFFDTTDGWDAPFLDDRTAPRYPRHQRLNSDETALVNDHLARIGVQLIAQV
ncbi:gamma-glutamylcyclotransferase [Rhodobacteraceae bacterium M382]|nr:gamma-glutamylcyclotransferase [Rhodobacteraceae bacterium M382]